MKKLVLLFGLIIGVLFSHAQTEVFWKLDTTMTTTAGIDVPKAFVLPNIHTGKLVSDSLLNIDLCAFSDTTNWQNGDTWFILKDVSGTNVDAIRDYKLSAAQYDSFNFGTGTYKSVIKTILSESYGVSESKISDHKASK